MADASGNSIAGCIGGGAPNSGRARTREGNGRLYAARGTRRLFNQCLLFHAAERSQDSSRGNYSASLGFTAGSNLCCGHGGIRVASAAREFRIVARPRIVYRGGEG